MNERVYKRLIFTAAALFMAALGIGGYRLVSAYFTDAETTGNTITVGTNEIKIVEDFTPPEIHEGENRYKKTVQVENTGDVDCYIRVFSEFDDAEIRDISMISPDGKEFYSAEDYRNHLPEGWTYLSDDIYGPYYYYKIPVKPGEITPPLYQMIRTTFEDADDVKDYEIIVYAESIQLPDKHGSLFTGTDLWKQAWGEYVNHPALKCQA